jgi:serine/threonine-protein kinase
MGVVWRARDTATGEVVALKLLHGPYMDEPESTVRFEREAELARRVDSPHVVQLLGYGTRAGVPFLVMEYVSGSSLRELIRDHGPYAPDDARSVLSQIAEGLAAVHAAGVIHRDVKPSNVLVASDGTAKLGDFGVARALDVTRVTGTSTLLGTPAYMAPEGPVDERSDLYSLGIVAYELLTGVVPFAGTTYQQVILRHVREAPDLARLPESERGLVGWLLAKDPARRPQDAEALLAALRATPAPPRTFVARRSTAALAGLAGLAVIAAGLIVATGNFRGYSAAGIGASHTSALEAAGALTTPIAALGTPLFAGPSAAGAAGPSAGLAPQSPRTTTLAPATAILTRPSSAPVAIPPRPTPRATATSGPHTTPPASNPLRKQPAPTGSQWPTTPPTGTWYEPSPGTTLGGRLAAAPQLQVAAHADPAVPNGAPVARVEFYAWWPALGPQSGPWALVCSAATPTVNDIYACFGSIPGIGAPTNGEIWLRFDVYDAADNVAHTVDGVLTIQTDFSAG